MTGKRSQAEAHGGNMLSAAWLRVEGSGSSVPVVRQQGFGNVRRKKRVESTHGSTRIVCVVLLDDALAYLCCVQAVIYSTSVC